MKKYMMILAVSAMMMLSSCGTYTGQGAYAGATFGSLLGSAIGGISGGWRGSNVGQIVGMAGGAAVGAAIGSAADKKEAERYEAYQRQREERSAKRNRTNKDYVYEDNESGFDATNSGDDRIDFDGAGPRNQRDSTMQNKNTTSPSSSKKLPFSYQPLQQ